MNEERPLQSRGNSTVWEARILPLGKLHEIYQKEHPDEGGQTLSKI